VAHAQLTMNRLRPFPLVLIVLIGAHLQAQEMHPAVRNRVLAQVDEIEQSLRDHPLKASDFPNFPKTSSALIEGARDAANRGYLYLSLEKLGQLLTVVDSTRFAEEQAGRLAPGFPAFDAEWTKATQKLAVVESGLKSKNWSHASPGQRALIEAARGRIGQMMSAARGFAVHEDTFSGLFYIGQALGQARFASLCASLDLDVRSQAKSHSVLPELQSLQEKALAAFVPPKSIELHSQFIVLNALLKTGFELDASRSYAGALYRYLDASQAYRVLDGIEVDAAKKAELLDKLASLRREFNRSRAKDSIDDIFLERAEAAASNGTNATAAKWRTVEAVVDHVLPASSAANLPVAASKQTSRKSVQLTLVRWPFT